MSSTGSILQYQKVAKDSMVDIQMKTKAIFLAFDRNLAGDTRESEDMYIVEVRKKIRYG